MVSRHLRIEPRAPVQHTHTQVHTLDIRPESCCVCAAGRLHWLGDFLHPSLSVWKPPSKSSLKWCQADKIHILWGTFQPKVPGTFSSGDPNVPAVDCCLHFNHGLKSWEDYANLASDVWKSNKGNCIHYTQYLIYRRSFATPSWCTMEEKQMIKQQQLSLQLQTRLVKKTCSKFLINGKLPFLNLWKILPSGAGNFLGVDQLTQVSFEFLGRFPHPGERSCGRHALWISWRLVQKLRFHSDKDLTALTDRRRQDIRLDKTRWWDSTTSEFLIIHRLLIIWSHPMTLWKIQTLHFCF